MPAIITAERPDHPEATALIEELEAHLASRYAAESRHGFSVQQLVDQQVAFFVLRADGVPAGCGGILLVGSDYGELKRMYVRPQFRGSGFGELILRQLAAHAQAHGVPRLRLETGLQQLAAIRMYERFGFRRIPPFGPYAHDPVSQCFEMSLAGHPSPRG